MGLEWMEETDIHFLYRIEETIVGETFGKSKVKMHLEKYTVYAKFKSSL